MRRLPLFFLFLLPLLTHAAGEITTLPAIGSAAPPATFPDYIRYFFVAAIGFAGISALIMITIAGIQYSVSGVVDTKARAKAQITSALLGLALILFSYIILRTINPDLVKLRLPSLTPATLTGKLPEFAPEGARKDLSAKKQCAPGLEESPKGAPDAICIKAGKSEEFLRRKALCQQDGYDDFDVTTDTCVRKPAPGTPPSVLGVEKERAESFSGRGTNRAEALSAERANGRRVGVATINVKDANNQITERRVDMWLSFDAVKSLEYFSREFAEACRTEVGETGCRLRITSTEEDPDGHESKCHQKLNNQSGTCADLVIHSDSCLGGVERQLPDGSVETCPLRDAILDAFQNTARHSFAILGCVDEYNGRTAKTTGFHYHCNFATAPAELRAPR